MTDGTKVLMYEMIMSVIIFACFLVLAITHNPLASSVKDFLPFVIGYWFKSASVAKSNSKGGGTQ